MPSSLVIYGPGTNRDELGAQNKTLAFLHILASKMQKPKVLH